MNAHDPQPLQAPVQPLQAPVPGAPHDTQASDEEGCMEQEKPLAIISLADSLQPLQDYFNSNQHERQFIAVLSPT